MKNIVLLSAIVATTVSTSSAAAAQAYDSSAPSFTRSAAFIGAQARLSLGTGKRAVPTARLTAAMTNLSFTPNGALVNRRGGSAFELGLSKSGRPDFYVGGQRYSELKASSGSRLWASRRLRQQGWRRSVPASPVPPAARASSSRRSSRKWFAWG